MKNKLNNFPDEHFDAVITKPTSDIRDYKELMENNDWKHIDRVLKPGAHIVVVTPENYDIISTQLRLAKNEIRDNIKVLHKDEPPMDNIKLFRYLIKMVTPPIENARILDPYQTDDIIQEAAELEGVNYTGIK
jgi:SAM-dependent methyltransferase